MRSPSRCCLLSIPPSQGSITECDLLSSAWFLQLDAAHMIVYPTISVPRTSTCADKSTALLYDVVGEFRVGLRLLTATQSGDAYAFSFFIIARILARASFCSSSESRAKRIQASMTLRRSSGSFEWFAGRSGRVFIISPVLSLHCGGMANECSRAPQRWPRSAKLRSVQEPLTFMSCCLFEGLQQFQELLAGPSELLLCCCAHDAIGQSPLALLELRYLLLKCVGSHYPVYNHCLVLPDAMSVITSKFQDKRTPKLFLRALLSESLLSEDVYYDYENKKYFEVV